MLEKIRGLIPAFRRENAEVKGSDWSWVDRLVLSSGIEGIEPNLVSQADKRYDNNSVIMACYNWAARNVIEPPIVLWEDSPTTETRKYIDDAALDPFRLPNTNWDQTRLLQAIALSWMFYGNCYILMLKDTTYGIAREIHWLEPWNMEVEGTLYPTKYTYTDAQGRKTEYRPDQIIHIANGVSTTNRLIGMSPLQGVLKWALTDNEAALYTLSIMKNQGKKTMMLVPKDEKGRFSRPTMEKLAALFQSGMTGAQSGKIIALDAGVDIKEVGMSPEESALDKMLTVPERKITSAFGIHMIVVGLLENPSYSNYGVAERVATEDFLLPLWKAITSAFTSQLYPYTPTYKSKPRAYYGFDLSKVRSLQEDEDKRHLRYNKDFYYGIITRAEARKALGFEVKPEDEIYYHDILAEMKESQQNSSESTPARRDGLPLEDTEDDRTPK